MLEIGELLRIVVERNASDLHLVVGKPPVLRIDGRLDILDYEPLTPEDTESIASPAHQQRVREVGGTEFGFAFGSLARFRVSIYREKGRISIAMRLIPYKLLSFEEIGLPDKIKELLYRPRGLILVTGPTGSGKTTTLATMIDYINTHRDCHILTIEDPIEYYHEHKRSIVTQRELGVDVPSFAEAIIRGLRQDPDVMMVGEMRDLATIDAALTAAETGHLVFSTLHTTGAAQTIDRIIDAFPTERQEQVRVQVSQYLIAVISQILIPRASGQGRVAAFEIMVAIPAIQSLIREKKTYRITSFIQTGARYGMRTLDQHLFELYSKGTITYEDMITRAQNPEELQQKVEGKV